MQGGNLWRMDRYVIDEIPSTTSLIDIWPSTDQTDFVENEPIFLLSNFPTEQPSVNSSNQNGTSLIDYHHHKILAPYPEWLVIVLWLLTAIFSIETILGNLLVLMAYKLERSIRRQLSNKFIVSLAVTDLIIGMEGFPLLTVYVVGRERWPLGQTLCQIWLCLDYTLCLVSILTVLLITVDRYGSVCYPAKYRIWQTSTRVRIFVVFSWIVPFLFFGLMIFAWDAMTGETLDDSGKCYAPFLNDPYVNMAMYIVYYWTTLVAVSVLYRGIHTAAKTLEDKSKARERQTIALLLGQRCMAQVGVGMLFHSNADDENPDHEMGNTAPGGGTGSGQTKDMTTFGHDSGYMTTTATTHTNVSHSSFFGKFWEISQRDILAAKSEFENPSVQIIITQSPPTSVSLSSGHKRSPTPPNPTPDLQITDDSIDQMRKNQEGSDSGDQTLKNQLVPTSSDQQSKNQAGIDSADQSSKNQAGTNSADQTFKNQLVPTSSDQSPTNLPADSTDPPTKNQPATNSIDQPFNEEGTERVKISTEVNPETVARDICDLSISNTPISGSPLKSISNVHRQRASLPQRPAHFQSSPQKRQSEFAQKSSLSFDEHSQTGAVQRQEQVQKHRSQSLIEKKQSINRSGGSKVSNRSFDQSIRSNRSFDQSFKSNRSCDQSIRSNKSADQSFKSTRSRDQSNGDQFIRSSRSANQSIRSNRSGNQSIKSNRSSDQSIRGRSILANKKRVSQQDSGCSLDFYDNGNGSTCGNSMNSLYGDPSLHSVLEFGALLSNSIDYDDENSSAMSCDFKKPPNWRTNLNEIFRAKKPSISRDQNGDLIRTASISSASTNWTRSASTSIRSQYSAQMEIDNPNGGNSNFGSTDTSPRFAARSTSLKSSLRSRHGGNDGSFKKTRIGTQEIFEIESAELMEPLDEVDLVVENRVIENDSESIAVQTREKRRYSDLIGTKEQRLISDRSVAKDIKGFLKRRFSDFTRSDPRKIDTNQDEDDDDDQSWSYQYRYSDQYQNRYDPPSMSSQDPPLPCISIFLPPIIEEEKSTITRTDIDLLSSRRSSTAFSSMGSPPVSKYGKSGTKGSKKATSPSSTPDSRIVHLAVPSPTTGQSTLDPGQSSSRKGSSASISSSRRGKKTDRDWNRSSWQSISSSICNIGKKKPAKRAAKVIDDDDDSECEGDGGEVRSSAEDSTSDRNKRPSVGWFASLFNNPSAILHRKRKVTKAEKRARKAFRTITVIVGTFALFWSPYYIVATIYGFCQDCVPAPLFLTSYYLCYLNSSVNPFAYAFANRLFRKTFIRILKGDLRRT